MPPLSPGTVIDSSFTLLRPIGEGGMGEVWLAREDALGREVALKIMLPSGGRTREERFEREARALAALNHPSILPVLRSGSDPATGRHYFATPAVLLSPSEITRVCDEVLHCPYPRGHAEAANEESHAEFAEGRSHAESAESAEGGSHAEFAESAEEESHAENAESAELGLGRDAPTARPPLVTRHPSLVTAAAPRPLPLSALLDGGKVLPEAAVLRIARDLAGALSAAHAAGILHRDVKPSNILFDATGRALLADFGLAKFTRGERTRAEFAEKKSHAEFAESAESPDGRAPSRPERSSGAAEAPDSISLDESGARKFLGSPAYAAPEQFRAGAALTPALDWYSLGAVLHEALTGGRPRSLRPPSSFDPAHVSRAWDPFLRDLLEPDPARRLADSAAIARRLDALARAIDPAARRRRRAAALALAAVFAGVAAVAVLIHAESPRAAEPRTPVDARPASRATARPQVLRNPILPPRLDTVWQGENRGPLQLLGVFRLAPVEALADEAFSSADPETLRLLREGDEAWASWHGNPDALRRAIRAWSAAVVRIEESKSAGRLGKSSPRLLEAFALVRLAWTYVANAEHGGADEPFRKALAAIDPLVESDPARYGPLRTWLLSERAYMECMEGRFRESVADLREAGVLWARYVMPLGDSCCVAQCYVIEASLGGMLRAIGDTDGAITMTYRAIDALEPFLFPDGSASPADPPHSTRSDSPVTRHPSLVTAAAEQPLLDLLAGCHYRLGEMHRETGGRIEAIAAFRRAADLWRDLFRTHGERYRDSCIQSLGRLGQSLADAERFEEAIAVWDETRDLLAPLLDSDPARYRPVAAIVIGNQASARRDLGDETAARALEAEAAALSAAP